MNTKIENLKKIQELFDKMPNEDKKRLRELLLTYKKEFVTDPLGTVRKCVQEMLKQEIDKFTDYVNRQVNDSSDEDYARAIGDSRRVERGKAFVEAMSSQARANKELLQQRRNEKYEEMIDEYDNSNSMGKSR